jgi:hypothetical protein
MSKSTSVHRSGDATALYGAALHNASTAKRSRTVAAARFLDCASGMRHLRLLRHGIVLVPLVLASCQSALDEGVALGAATCGDELPQQLSFRKQIRSKLFIDRIPLASCQPYAAMDLSSFLPGIVANRVAEYMAFCKVTDLSYQERPATGTESPLEARILAKVDLDWTCTAGSAVPSSGSMTVHPAVGGTEIGPIAGIVNPMQSRDTLTSNGEFSYVASGHPNPLLEPPFQYFWPRSRTDIWHKVTGKVTCTTDANGVPGSTVSVRIAEATKFPSHRVYLYDFVNGQPQFERMAAWIPQQAFSNLWNLSPVGSP